MWSGPPSHTHHQRPPPPPLLTTKLSYDEISAKPKLVVYVCACACMCACVCACMCVCACVAQVGDILTVQFEEAPLQTRGHMMHMYMYEDITSSMHAWYKM